MSHTTSLAPELHTKFFWLETCLQPEEKKHSSVHTKQRKRHSVCSKGGTSFISFFFPSWLFLLGSLPLCHNLLTLLFTSAKQSLQCTSQRDRPTSTACSFSHLILKSFTTPTFCMLSRTSEVLMVPLANLNLSRLATDSSPAFGLMEGTGSPKKKIQ